MTGHLLLVAGGLVLITLGAEWLVRGASRGAASLSISPVVVGLTIVALGTSAPEVALGLLAISEGRADLALGNVVGSNIFNVLVILGASAVVTPLVVQRKLLVLHAPLLVALSVIVLLLGLDGAIGRIEGGLLVTGLVAYVGLTIRDARRNPPPLPSSAEQEATGSMVANIALFLFGLALLAGGARLLVNGAAAIAQAAGVSELMIGLTILAGGTSLPEVATSLVAAARGQNDIAVGNAIGSSIFNLLGVLGLTAAIAPDGVAVAADALTLDLPLMAATAAVCLPVFFTGERVDRWEGAMLLAHYAGYLTYLILQATGHDAAGIVGLVMAGIFVPLTAAMLLVATFRARRGGPSFKKVARISGT